MGDDILENLGLQLTAADLKQCKCTEFIMQGHFPKTWATILPIMIRLPIIPSDEGALKSTY
jgi:hypothetical protein